MFSSFPGGWHGARTVGPPTAVVHAGECSDAVLGNLPAEGQELPESWRNEPGTGCQAAHGRRPAVRAHGHVGPSLGTRTVAVSLKEHVGGSAQVTNVAGLDVPQLSSGSLEGDSGGEGPSPKYLLLGVEFPRGSQGPAKSGAGTQERTWGC